MKQKEILKKSGIFIVLVLFGFVFSQIMPGNSDIPAVQASSVKKTVKKAKKAYEKKMESFATEYDTDGYYRIVDVTGDKVPELLIDYGVTSRHGALRIYTYKKGKLKKILDIGNDNLTIYVYRKTKTLLIYDGYHGYNERAYYKYTKGKFRLKAKKCNNDAAEIQNWYENSSGNNIRKKKFNKIIKPLKKGKKKNLNYYESWTRFPEDNGDYENDED